MELTLDYEDLDPETLEDIEISLYGMLHHAPAEEFNCRSTLVNAASSNPKVRPPLLPTPDIPPLLLTPDQSSPTTEKPSTQPSSEKRKSLKDVTDREPKPASTKEHVTKGKKVEPRKVMKARPAGKPKKNPFAEYLVVEKSVAKKSSDIIDVSDEEDSRYATINKSSQKTSKTINYRGMQGTVSTTLPVQESDGSDDDSSSVVILDAAPETPSSDEPILCLTETDESDSDSDVEIIGSSNTSLTADPVLRLNVNEPRQLTSNDAALNRAGIVTRLNLKKELDRPLPNDKWTPEMFDFYNREGSHVDLDAVFCSIPDNVRWHLDGDDLNVGKQRNRYFAKSKVRCANCNQWDHTTKSCREPRKVVSCGICGTRGHKALGCPKKICLGCGRSSKILIECCPECRKERKAVCMICRLNHLTTQCPDLWRRYHLTVTKQEEPTPSDGSLKPSRLQYCSNCAERGHLAINCRELRWSKFPPVSPEVFSYQDAGKFLNEVTDGGKKAVNISDDGKSVWVVGNYQPENGRSPHKSRNQKYYIPMGNTNDNEGAMQSVKRIVLSEIKNVDINWRKQAKKKRVLVEFTGNGNTMEAKIRFRKMINFRMRKPNKTENRKPPSAPVEENLNANPVAEPTEDKGKALKKKKKEPKITAVSIVHLNNEGKEMRRTVRCQLIDKEKRNLGSLLSKLELRNRVRITSSVTGKSWDIVINNVQRGNSSSAFYSIVRFLDAASARPAGV